MLNAHAILQVVLAAEIGIERSVLKDPKRWVRIGADVSLAESGPSGIASLGLARRSGCTDPRDIYSR